MAAIAIVGSQESFISAVAEAFIAQTVEASEAAARITVVASTAITMVTMASVGRTVDTGQHKLELGPIVTSSDWMSVLKFIAIMAAVIEGAAVGYMKPMELAELQRHLSAGLIDQMLAHS